MSFELIILGSSSALPTSKRSTAAHLLNINERFFLIDCGEGAQIQMRRLRLSPARINHIFISHLHGDHVFGLFGLISSLGLMGRNADLHLYGPSGLEELLDSCFGFFGTLPFSLVHHCVENGQIVFEDSKTEVRAIELLHRTPTFGYLFKEKPKMLNIRKDKIEDYRLGVEEIVRVKKGEDLITSNGVIPNRELTYPPWHCRSYAYISDTAYFPEIANIIQDVDLLFHEATFLERDRKLALETYHSTAMQAATIALKAKAKKLLIGHFSTRYKDSNEFRAEAEQFFKSVVCVSDGDRYHIDMYREEEENFT